MPTFRLHRIGTVHIFRNFSRIITDRNLAIVTIRVRITTLARALNTRRNIRRTSRFQALFVRNRNMRIKGLSRTIQTRNINRQTNIFNRLINTRVDRILSTLSHNQIRINKRAKVTRRYRTFLRQRLRPITTNRTITQPIIRMFIDSSHFGALIHNINNNFNTNRRNTKIRSIRTFILRHTRIRIISHSSRRSIRVMFTAMSLFIPTRQLLRTIRHILTLISIFQLSMGTRHRQTLNRNNRNIFSTPGIANRRHGRMHQFRRQIFPNHPIPTIFTEATNGQITIKRRRQMTILLNSSHNNRLTRRIQTIRMVNSLTGTFNLTLDTRRTTKFMRAFRHNINFQIGTRNNISHRAFTLQVRYRIIFDRRVIINTGLTINRISHRRFRLLTVRRRQQRTQTTLKVATRRRLHVSRTIILRRLRNRIHLISRMIKHLVILRMGRLQLFNTRTKVLGCTQQTSEPYAYRC